MKKNLTIKFHLLILISLVTINTFAQDTWTAKANFGGIVRDQAVGFSIGTKGYIGTGFNGVVSHNQTLNDFWEYNQATDTWTQKADFGGAPRLNAVGFSIGSKGYIGTGIDSLGNNLNDFWQYDPIGNTWTPKANFGGLARSQAIGFSIGTNGYIGIGAGASLFNDFWEYNSLTDIWTAKANYTGLARYSSTGFAIGSKGYIGTGFDGSSSKLKEFYEYNPATNSWTPKANFGGTKRRNAVGFSIGNKGYIGTGADSIGFQQDFWEYDTLSNIWTQKANFGGGNRYLATGFSIGSKGYIGTGGNPFLSGFYKDLWEYSPSSTVGILENNNGVQISISPNPSTGSFNILISEPTKNGTIEVYNNIGELVLSKTVTSQQNTIDLSNQANGLYFIKAISDNKIVGSQKIVKE